MNLNIPQHLASTSSLLGNSLKFHPNETPPSIPGDLLQDLNHRFAPTQRVVIEPKSHRRSSFSSMLQRLFAAPALGAAALIAIVLSVAVPSFMSSSQSEGFRGAEMANTQSVPILLTGAPADMADVLAGTGDFERESLLVMEDINTAFQMEGAKVIVNFHEGRLLSVDEHGDVISATKLPEDISELSLAIALAVSAL